MCITVNLYLYNIKYIYKNRIIISVNNLLKYKFLNNNIYYLII